MLDQVFSLFIVSCLFGILGCIAIWGQSSFLGHTLSHSLIFPPAVCVALGLYNEIAILFATLSFAIVFGLLCVFIKKRTKNNHDTTLLFVSLIFPAVAILIANATDNKIDLMSYLVGDLFIIGKLQIYLLISIFAISIVYVARYWQVILLNSFSHTMSIVFFKNTLKVETLGILLQSSSIAITVNAVGALLMSGSYIIPAILARQFAKSPLSMVIISVCIAIISNFIGFAISHYYSISLTPVVIIIYMVIGGYSLIVTRKAPRTK